MTDDEIQAVVTSVRRLRARLTTAEAVVEKVRPLLAAIEAYATLKSSASEHEHTYARVLVWTEVRPVRAELEAYDDALSKCS